ncbi:hypothetical protein [Limoniibacter endophyticus]|uniref:hypothetical protein n=1 Tax=Limoniibacter endophyticus TaxID=1565040 RepID=UPI001FCE39F9|nr:hypothetical protein [Limoniibacter endophyticus]
MSDKLAANIMQKLCIRVVAKARGREQQDQPGDRSGNSDPDPDPNCYGGMRQIRRRQCSPSNLRYRDVWQQPRRSAEGRQRRADGKLWDDGSKQPAERPRLYQLLIQMCLV